MNKQSGQFVNKYGISDSVSFFVSYSANSHKGSEIALGMSYPCRYLYTLEPSSSFTAPRLGEFGAHLPALSLLFRP